MPDNVNLIKLLILYLPFRQYLSSHSRRFASKLFKRVFIEILRSINLSTIPNRRTNFLSSTSSPSTIPLELVPYFRPKAQLYVSKSRLPMFSMPARRVYPFCSGILKVGRAQFFCGQSAPCDPIATSVIPACF